MPYAAIRVPRLSNWAALESRMEARAVMKVKSSLNQAEQRIKGDDLTETGKSSRVRGTHARIVAAILGVGGRRWGKSNSFFLTSMAEGRPPGWSALQH